MKFARQTLLLGASLAAALTLTACNKSDDSSNTPAAASTTPATPAPAATPAAPASAAAPMSAPAGTAASTSTAAAAPAAVTVTSVDLGTAVDAAKKINAPTTTFSPKDTIYASIATTGSGNVNLGAKWTYQDGQTVKQDGQAFTPTGPANTAFEISKPDGLPAGNYKVEISAGGNVVSTKDFSVK
jgi:cytoskeletal protein RodZ